MTANRFFGCCCGTVGFYLLVAGWVGWPADAASAPSSGKIEVAPHFFSPNEFEGTDVERINQAIAAMTAKR